MEGGGLDDWLTLRGETRAGRDWAQFRRSSTGKERLTWSMATFTSASTVPWSKDDVMEAQGYWSKALKRQRNSGNMHRRSMMPIGKRFSSGASSAAWLVAPPDRIASCFFLWSLSTSRRDRRFSDSGPRVPCLFGAAISIGRDAVV